MSTTSCPAIAILDIGKTNKKSFLLDEEYQVVFEKSEQLPEITDEDGFPCEDIGALTRWVKAACGTLTRLKGFHVKAINVSAYGASLVHIDAVGNVLTPLYNYLKPISQELENDFYKHAGGREAVSLATASPALGNLNWGIQLYRLRKEKHDIFSRIRYSMHLPQFVSWLISGQPASDMTSIGCHTALWDFQHNTYHRWVLETIVEKFPPILPSTKVFPATVDSTKLVAGIGLHDSSAALIPYQDQFKDPFVLLSTGTWNISLNPFNSTPLTADELRKDCLCYLDHQGNPVKASRLFAGNEHDHQTTRIAEHFHVATQQVQSISFDPTLLRGTMGAVASGLSTFNGREISGFKSYEQAYHQLVLDLVREQANAIDLVIEKSTTHLFVDGGFSKNEIFMNLLSSAFPERKVFAATIHQASAFGAALVIHDHWNSKPRTGKRIVVKLFLPVVDAIR